MKQLLSKSEKRRYQQHVRMRFYGLIAVIIFAAAGALYGVLHLSFLKIKSIAVSGVVTLEDLRPLVLANPEARLLGLSNFLSWPDEIRGVTVEKNYGKGILTLTGPNADRFAIWCAKDCFWVNRQGLAVAEAPDTEGSTIVKINDSRQFTPMIGREVLPPDRFAAVAALLDGLAGVPLTLSDYAYKDTFQEIVITPARGAQLMFSVRFIPNKKVFSSLANLIASGKISASSYADFTVENRIYLK